MNDSVCYDSDEEDNNNDQKDLSWQYFCGSLSTFLRVHAGVLEKFVSFLMFT